MNFELNPGELVSNIAEALAITLAANAIALCVEPMRIRRDDLKPAVIDLAAVEIARHFDRRNTDTWVARTWQMNSLE